MSVSGVGGSSSWFAQWAALQQARSSAPAQQAVTAAAAPGLPVTGIVAGGSSVQTVTGASGRAMNGQDAQSFQQTMASLSQDLNAGDLSAAQGDFAKLKQLVQGSGVHGHHHHHGGGKKAAADPAAASSTSNPFASAFDAVGQSLQNGDLAGAQSAMSQLDTLLASAQRKLTVPPIGADSPANPAGGTIDAMA